MCGITGWIDWKKDAARYAEDLKNMTRTLAHRGPDDTGTWFSGPCAFGHTRLAVMDLENGKQPMIREAGGKTFAIVYNGELYNAGELRRELQQRGYRFRTNCDTEVVLLSHIEWGESCVGRFNGIYAYAVWDDAGQACFLARDRLGVKPLFFALKDETLIFASEPKAILSYPGFRAEVDAEGLAEVFAIGPARTPGHGIYRHMRELKPGYSLRFDRSGLSQRQYWKLESRPFTDDAGTAAERIRELLCDAVRIQLASDVPICTMLSGGLDSSALTTIASRHLKRNGCETLHTFSVDYRDNDIHFQTNDFQPNADAPWIRHMADFLGTTHHHIVFDTPELVSSLRLAVKARDLPGMADIDGSLYLFCREIKRHATVAISGEAADEIFGGYPWFHREEMLTANTFPWSLATKERASLLSSDLKAWIRPEDYVARRYREAIAEVPALPGETQLEQRRREMSYLNITRFMPTLLDRKDRMSMAGSLEVRVPFCDHRIVEYMWNVPWDVKTTGNREKGLLRKALEGILPKEVLSRKKSPYPKTFNPNYLSAVQSELRNLLHDPSSPLLPLIDKKNVETWAFDDTLSDHKPWFGQLMGRAQMIAYLLQVDMWLREYRVSIV